MRVKLLAYLEDRLGQSFHAIVVGVEDFGLFCRLTELPIDGLIHVSSLRDDYYYLEPATHTLVGRRSGRRHRLGDREHRTRLWVGLSKAQEIVGEPLRQNDQIGLDIAGRQSRCRAAEVAFPNPQPLARAACETTLNRIIHHNTHI